MRQSAPIGANGRQALVQEANDATALYRLTDQLYRARTVEDVYAAALDAIVDTLGCRRASILLFDETGIMRFVAARGLSEEYRLKLAGHTPWKPGQRDPQPIFVSDIAQSDEPDWVKAAVKKETITALGFIPLVAQGGVIGKFMTYYEGVHDFPQHEVDLAVTIARQLGFALERMRAEAARQEAGRELRHSEEHFRLMSEHAPVMIWTSDERGACLHLNRMLREFWGVDEAAIAGFDWSTTMHPDDAPAIGAAMAKAMAEKTSVRVKGRFRRADGIYRTLETDARPRIGARGEFLGMIGVNVDVTEREQSEHALRESEQRFRRAVEAAPSGMLMTNAYGRIVMVNAQAEKLFGYSREELVGEPIERLVPQRYRANHPGFRDAYGKTPSARPMGAGRELFALRKDGSEVPVEIGLSPIETPEGPMALAAVVDISGRKQADAQRELLLAELSHRVKNTLAVVQGIANQTFKGGGASPEARRAFEGRLFALARAHDLLIQSHWETASLEDLAADTLEARGVSESRIALSGPHVLLRPREALSIAMALHELFTNAIKYGALSNEAGRVTLTWTVTDEPQPHLTLTWREQGGPPVAPPRRRGFGSLLLERTLARDLDGEVEVAFKPEGLTCTISAPLARYRARR